MNVSYLRSSNIGLTPQMMDRVVRGLAQMSKWFSGGREPPRAALEKIVGYFHRVDRPVYLGYVSTEIGYSLDQTQSMLEALQEAGVVRQLTDEEKKSQKIDVRANLWVLVDRAHPGKASW